jgi:hypothetical protein
MLNHHGRSRSMLAGALLLAAVALPEARAQDLQPGRNFPSSIVMFGADRTADINSGDADNDGDLDVLTGNGMDGPAQTSRIFINLGGLQAGTEGSFADESATRFAGQVAERTRDIGFVDVEQDGDLDIFQVTEGPSATGSVQRFYTNLGGVQAGTIGFWTETTATFWGTLVSVPLDKQVFGGNAGPWRGFGWDSDFTDLDLDGDLDLFWTSSGPNLVGTEDSRVFLNDGSGVFDELHPWADPAADIKLHGRDTAVADFDGDFDLDIVVASRDTQSRAYLNNLYGPLGASAFQDVTQPAIIDTGAAQSGQVSYETETFDADGDGDFDLWSTNYQFNLDRVLRNDGLVAGTFTFSEQTTWIGSDPNVDEQGGDPLDYDNDGDLDFTSANFTGTDWIYRSSVAQTGTAAPLFRRTGISIEPPELPTTGNGFITLDVECCDIDGDGDTDILHGNDGNAGNRLLVNALGVPDSHAPTFARVETVADKPVGPDARVIAQVRDNEPIYGVSRELAVLHWTENFGPPQSAAMFAQGGQQFMGHLPGGVAGVIQYHVECTDLAGNTGVSETQTYYQGVVNPWTNLGFAKAGVNGLPELEGVGTLVPGSPATLTLSNAAPNAVTFLFLGPAAGNVPFLGGTLVPFPVAFTLALVTDGDGGATLAGTWPVAPSGTTVVFQAWIEDAGATFGAAASNGLQGVSP